MLEDDYVKDNTVILVKLDVLMENIKVIKEIKKRGYKVATVLENQDQLKAKFKRNLNVVNFIFVEKENIKLKDSKAFLAKDLHDKIIFDEVMQKTGGSEDE